MSPIHFSLLLIFGVLFAYQYQPVVASFCALWVDHSGMPQFEMKDFGLANYDCKSFCYNRPGASETFSCTWIYRTERYTCTMKVNPDGNHFSFPPPSVCPDPNGNPYEIREKPDPLKTEPKPANENEANGIGSTNPNVFFLWMIIGGSLALIWMVLADGGRFGGGGGIL